MIRLLTAMASLALVAQPALAQPANLQPTRDVTVTYRMNAPGMAGVPGTAAPPQGMQMAFSASDGKQRIDPPGGMGWMLVDRKANTAVMVMDAQRATMAMPPATVAAMTQGVPPGATFTRKGTATVAGTACTEWEVAAGPGRGTSCITEDGVLLRTTTTPPGGTPTTVMEATQVAYGPVEAARLKVPSGYTAMATPGGAPGAPGTAPGR
ncbi:MULTISPECIES: hypothetical protein [Methylobacterium]|uniref:DUF4412 domain-containing protein n=1 Tax=Methylobacterium bullatum TaxID=570505 RepID=A0A679JTZ7_9HYPH|nr:MULTISPECIES: hypothetical protein [Methylobacterium]TXN30535.1 hypothetical protein FV220_06520 [Methylobacterium sp. WL19]GJD37586.1 hypothetical protein OICFNHDK_0023 [Methylobacterium bullatum]CAA2138430.1 hypothetical protein MBLL_01142 [Methylobacterium bullatum]